MLRGSKLLLCTVALIATGLPAACGGSGGDPDTEPPPGAEAEAPMEAEATPEAGAPGTGSAVDVSSTPAARCEELGSLLAGAASASGDVCRVTFPRGDLAVELLGAHLPPGMGLTSWAAFAPAGDRGSIVMGDLALTGEELPVVMAALRERGLRATAVHRHMAGETPAMSYMHYLGVGPAEELARALAAALDAVPSARGGQPATGGPAGGPGTEGAVAGVACEAIARALGADPGSAGRGPGYCKVSLPRQDLSVRVEDVPVPASLGIGSWFAFRETAEGGSAVIAGDMALTEEQVNPAIAALRERGIEVVALHNHMLFDEPRVVFFHFQARGAPLELARGLAAGLEAAGLRREGSTSGPRAGG